jgi:hypothetical protein
MIVRLVTDEDRPGLIAAWEQMLAQLAPARVCWHEWTWPTPPLEDPSGQGGGRCRDAVGGQLGVAQRVTVTIEFGPDEPWPYGHRGPGMAP